MKKIIAMTSALVFCLGMSGCGNSGGESISPAETTAATTTTAAETTAVTATTTAATTSVSSETSAETTSESAGGSEQLEAAGETAPSGVKEYRISGGGHLFGNYYINLVEGESYDRFYKLTIEDSELADALIAFSSYFDIKTDASGGTLGEYELTERDGGSLGQLTAKEIMEKYDPAAKYEVTEWSYDGEVKLSELEEGKMYEAPAKDDTISFVNDTDTDYLVWVSDTNEFKENSYIYPAKRIGDAAEDKPVIYVFGNVRVRIEKLTADMLTDESYALTVAFVNDVPKGEEVFIGTASVLANAGSTSVTVDITDTDEAITELTLEAGEVYATDFMKISSVVVK